MQSALLTSSRFGKFYPKSEQNHKKLELKSSGPLQKIQFTVTGDKIYLLDTTGNLICLTLDDSSISTFGTVKSQHFQIDSYNSFSVYAVSKQSQLWHVSFQSKKKDKIVNLSMGRVLSFQKNPFTNLLLIVELQLVMIISPSSNNYKITSIKSTNGQVFTCGKFLNQNRFLILAIKTNQLRLVQVLGLKTIETITLPFDIKGLKLQTTSDGSAIAVFGESNMLVIVNVNPNGKLRFQICELPVKSVLELKFTYENDIIFLGNNRIIYGIDAQKKGKIVQIFNYSDKIGFSSFDISLNSKKLALISGSSVHILTYPSGIHKIIEQSKGSILQFTYQGGQSTMKVDREIEYDDEQLDSSTQNLQKHSNYIGDLPKFDEQSDEPGLELPQQINTLKIPHSQKIRVHKIFNFLYEIDHLRLLAHLHKKQTIQLIAKYLTIQPNPTKVLLGVYHLLSTYEKAIEDESMQRYALILAPRVFERVQKVDGQFKHYLTKQLLSTFQDYLSQSKQSQIIKILLKNSQRQWFVPIFLVCLLMQLRNHSQSWPHPHIQQLQLDQVLKETQNLLQNPRHAYIFAKQPIKRTQDDEQNLQSLLRKQNELKKELEQVQRQYN